MASQHETVVEALRTWLAAIVGGSGGYVYTPVVWRTSFFEEQDLDVTKDVVYLLRPSQERKTQRTSCDVKTRLELFLLVAKRFEVASERPGETQPQRWQMVADVVADACQKLFSDLSFGDATHNRTVLEDSIVIDYERYAPKWAMAEIRFVVRYNYDKTASR